MSHPDVTPPTGAGLPLARAQQHRPSSAAGGRERRLVEQAAMREELDQRRNADAGGTEGRRTAAAYAGRVAGQETLLLGVQLALLVAAGLVGAAVAGGLGLLAGLGVGVVAVGLLRLALWAAVLRAALRARRRRQGRG